MIVLAIVAACQQKSRVAWCARILECLECLQQGEWPEKFSFHSSSMQQKSNIMNEVSSLEKWELKCFTESAGEAATEVADAGQEVVEAGMGA